MDVRSLVARVIVKDDDVDRATAFAALLRFEMPGDVDVIVAHDGLEALEEASKASPPVAVVVDLSTPGTTGLETAAAIRWSSPPNKDAVLVAVSGDDNLLDCARRSGYFQMIQRKPVDFEALFRLLKRLQVDAS